MKLYTSTSLKNALKNQLRRLKNKQESLEKLSSRLSTIRLFDFLLMVVVLYFAAKLGNTILFYVILAAAIAGFMALISWHRKIDEGIKRFAGMIKIRSRHLARIDLSWQDIPAPPLQNKYDGHPFARDFDIVNEHSVMHLINTSTYKGGTGYLEKWLLNRTPDPEKTEQRQKLVKELKPMAHFRDRLHLKGQLSQVGKSKFDWDMNDLVLWLRATQKKGFNLPLLILGTLSFLNIALATLFFIGLLKPWFIITFVIYLITYNFYSAKISGLFGEASQIKDLLSQFREVLLYLESFPYNKASELKKMCSVFHKGEDKPSNYLKKIIRIASAASSQSSELMWAALNFLVPWDMYFAKKLNTYKKELEPKLDTWLDTFYRLEALNSMANFAWINPAYTFALPQKTGHTPVLEAEDLGHPLIKKSQKITNDVTINNTGDIQLVTGSNMAGKSTFLRTIGINLCLFFAGSPVDAKAFKSIPFRLFSSINVTDSLDEGLSHFYAEVKRLRQLMEQLEKPHHYPLFFMVDEIYRGTNNRERLTGSTAFLKHVAGKNGVGLVSTHDLELAQLEEEIPTLSNWHFEETIEDGKMHFEYKLKTGPCPSTNALKIMQMEGLPV